MSMIFGIPIQAFMGQILIGLINGSFYALLSLGLAVIFGLLRVINFAHGAQYMLGAFVALLALNWLGINYWFALILAPLVVGAFGALVERTMLSRLYKLDHLYGLLFTFGLALTLVHLVGIPITNLSVNPARSTGPGPCTVISTVMDWGPLPTFATFTSMDSTRSLSFSNFSTFSSTYSRMRSGTLTLRP